MGNRLSNKKRVEHGATDADIDEFLAHVRPLDLLVFRGADRVSNLIRGLERRATGNGSISHVEMAITRNWCPRIQKIKTDQHHAGRNDTDDALLSWGSTMSGPLSDGVKNAETDKSKFGSQVRVLHDLVKEYLSNPDTNVGVCRLRENPVEQRHLEPYGAYIIRKAELRQQLSAAYDEYNGNTYDANPLALLGAIYPKFRKIRDDTSNSRIAKLLGVNQWLFCSELVALVYISIGVIDDETDGVIDGRVLDAHDVVPVDFLGVDVDDDGIVNSICEMPIWVKPIGITGEDTVHELVPITDDTTPENIVAGADAVAFSRDAPAALSRAATTIMNDRKKPTTGGPNAVQILAEDDTSVSSADSKGKGPISEEYALRDAAVALEAYTMADALESAVEPAAEKSTPVVPVMRLECITQDSDDDHEVQEREVQEREVQVATAPADSAPADEAPADEAQGAPEKKKKKRRIRNLFKKEAAQPTEEYPDDE